MSLREVYEHYGERVQFLQIYIREAHPTDGWYMGNHDIRDPRDHDERRGVAGMCKDALRLDIPVLVDDMDDTVMKAYAAWPDRLYLVGEDGRIVYVGRRGPWDYKPAQLGQAIDELLACQH